MGGGLHIHLHPCFALSNSFENLLCSRYVNRNMNICPPLKLPYSLWLCALWQMKLFRKEGLFVKDGPVGKVLRVQKIFCGLQTLFGVGVIKVPRHKVRLFPYLKLEIFNYHNPSSFNSLWFWACASVPDIIYFILIELRQNTCLISAGPSLPPLNRALPYFGRLCAVSMVASEICCKVTGSPSSLPSAKAFWM